MRLTGTSEERLARVCLVVAMAIAAVVILWLGRETTFWIDELTVYLQSPGLTLEEALRTHIGHLVVTVRLLDPPLHEFIPDVEELLVRDAKGQLDDADRKLLTAAQAWRESNPMLGTCTACR